MGYTFYMTQMFSRAGGKHTEMVRERSLRNLQYLGSSQNERLAAFKGHVETDRVQMQYKR